MKFNKSGIADSYAEFHYGLVASKRYIITREAWTRSGCVEVHELGGRYICECRSDCFSDVRDTDDGITIRSFDKYYFFLSNFYERPVVVDGNTYTNSEAAFHAFKCHERRGEFTFLGPKEAKRLGRSVKLRPDWEQVKDDVMRKVVRAKFTQHEDLKQMLLETGDAILEEGNTWNDKYWGVDSVTRDGKNMLGKILMEIRDELRA